MANRDPNKTARNRLIEAFKIKLRELLPDVLSSVKSSSVRDNETDQRSSLNQDIRRISNSEKEILGTAFLGTWLLLRNSR